VASFPEACLFFLFVIPWVTEAWPGTSLCFCFSFLSCGFLVNEGIYDVLCGSGGCGDGKEQVSS
jgi:hypothetical protein